MHTVSTGGVATVLSNQEPEHLHWFIHKQKSVDNRDSIPRKYPNYKELLEQAKVNKAFRKANPDPDRCRFCFTTDSRMVTVRYSVMACPWPKKGRKKLDKGYVYAHVWREHRVCNQCHPSLVSPFKDLKDHAILRQRVQEEIELILVLDELENNDAV